MKYTPINQAHAIVEAIIYIQFSPAFSEKMIRNIIDAQNAIEKLPKKELVTSFTAEFNEQGVSKQTTRTVGQESKRIGPDDSLQWMVRAQENVIACHCLDYERWEDFYKVSRSFLDGQFASIMDENPIVLSVGLRVVDKFVFNGEIAEYDQEGLFQSQNPFLAARVTERGDRWHCHTGWFDGGGAPNLELLHQLNIDATRNYKDNKPFHVTTIVHNCVWRTNEAAGKNDWCLSSLYGKPDEDKLSEIWHLLHQENKKLLSELLCEDMRKRINLKLEGVG